MPNAISAGNKDTLEVAKEILKAGGNAFDAGVAAHFAMFITEPCMASAGGGGFALTKTTNGPVSFFDFFCHTPRIHKLDAPDFYPITVDFGTDQEVFYIGLGAVAVPGTIAGLFEIHQRYGSIPMHILLQPAIALAKYGVSVSEFLAEDLLLLSEILGQSLVGKKLFFEDGQVLRAGQQLIMPNCIDFLEYLGREGIRGFYEGDIAKIIDKDSQNRGGFLRRNDLENYRVNVTKPLNVLYKDNSIFLPNGPSKGGAMLALFLANLNQSTIPVAIQKTQKVSKDVLELARNMSKHYPIHNYKSSPSASAASGTSHFNISDSQGNVISLTTSIGEGSGYFIPGTDMQLNNMLGEIFLLPGNAHSWYPNQRMHSMMTPTMITNLQNQMKYVGGSGGASRIPYAIGQVIHHLFDQKLSLKSATNEGRFHFQDDMLQVEKGAHLEGQDVKTNFWDHQSLYFGGVHSIKYNQNGIEAVGDERRHGVAEVF